MGYERFAVTSLSIVDESNSTNWTLSAIESPPIIQSSRYGVAHLLVTSLVLGAIILATIVGNVFVIAAIIVERNLRNVANYLIASLAVADLLVAALVMPLAAVNEVSSRWFLGREACDAFISFDVLCCTASILHLVAISLDRYWAVTRVDYIHNRSARRIWAMVAASWGISALISFPPLFVTRNPRFDPDVSGVCLISQDWAYTVFSTLGAFYLPMLVMSVIYARVYRTARRRIRKRTFRRAPGRSGGESHRLGRVESDRLADMDSRDSPTPRPLLLDTSYFNVESSPAAAVVSARRLSSIRHSVLPVPDTEDEQNADDDDDDDDDEEEDDGEETGSGNYSAATAVGNACTIILAAAATTTNPGAVETPSTSTTADRTSSATDHRRSSRPSALTAAAKEHFQSAPFFARFLDGSWLSAAARYRRRVDDDAATDDDDGTVVNGNNPRAAVVLQANMAATQRRRAREKQEQKRERKAARTLAIVTGTFVVCWLPFFILALVRPFCGDRCHYPALLVSVISWLGYFNSLLNPVIYTVFNPDFRSAFRKILFGKYRGGHSTMHALQHLPFGLR